MFAGLFAGLFVFFFIVDEIFRSELTLSASFRKIRSELTLSASFRKINFSQCSCQASLNLAKHRGHCEFVACQLWGKLTIGLAHVCIYFQGSLPENLSFDFR